MKRGNGEGTIYRRESDGLFIGELGYTDAAGRRRKVKRAGKTAAIVRAKLREVADRLEAGAPVKDSSATVAAWVAHWSVTGLQAGRQKQSTKDLYEGLCRVHAAPAGCPPRCSEDHAHRPPFGELAVGQVRPTHVDALLLFMREQGYAGSTLRNMFAALKNLFALAKRDRLIRDHPLVGVDRPSAAAAKAVFLEADEAARLLAAAVEDPRLDPIVRLMMATGVRRGEVLGAHWSALDLEAGTWHIDQELTRIKGQGLVLGPPKSESSDAVLSIGVGSVALLRARHRRQLEERLAAGPAWQPTDLVFTLPDGRPMDPRAFNRRFAVIVRRAGLDPAVVTPHTLRHTAASLMLDAGVHMKVIQEQLRHADYATTARVYAHVAPQKAREAADALDAAVLGGGL